MDNEPTNIPRGKPKSGRVWKAPRTKFSSINKTKGLKRSFEMKQQFREEIKRVKELSREIISKNAAEKEAKKERRRQNLKRAEENQRKAEVVQVITNTAKLKRMKKKQLRNVVKRNTKKKVDVSNSKSN